MYQKPTPFEIRRLTSKDLSAFKSLLRLFKLVFEEPGPTHGSDASLQSLLDNPTFIALVAVSDREVLGGLTAYELPLYYSDSSEIFLYDLAVKPEFQRMGIGKGLLDKLKEYCREHGIALFFVMADEEDEHAVEFYRSTGGKSEKVVNFVYQAGKA